MKKSLLLLFSLCSILVLLFGNKPDAVVYSQQNTQSNAFRISRYADKDGKIYLSYCFPINSSFMEQNGFSSSEINTFKFYLTIYVSTLAKFNKDKEIDGVTVGNCVYFTDYDSLGFTISFDSVEVQKKFFNVEESSASSSKTKSSGFFIKKIEIETLFPISSAKSAEDVKAVCVMATNSWCKDNEIKDERKDVLIKNYDNAIFIYDFATVTDELKSESMYFDEKGYHNVFVKTKEEIEENNIISFWVTTPNKPIWYLCALTAVLVAVFVAILLSKKNFIKKY